MVLPVLVLIVCLACFAAGALLFYQEGYNKGYRASENQKYTGGDFRTEMYNSLQRSFQSVTARLHKDIAHWQGKFMQVKHENNVLRRKLYQSKQ